MPDTTKIDTIAVCLPPISTCVYTTDDIDNIVEAAISLYFFNILSEKIPCIVRVSFTSLLLHFYNILFDSKL